MTRAVLEGCVGETLAALEANEAAGHATDTILQGVLSRIAEDEARHAELSWRFLSWALAQGGPALRSVVNSAFQRAAANLVTSAASAARRVVLDAQLLAHGVLPPSHAAQLRLTVFESVIRPCVDALLAPSTAAGSATAFGVLAPRS